MAAGSNRSNKTHLGVFRHLARYQQAFLSIVLRRRRGVQLDALVRDGIPSCFVPGLRFLVTGTTSDQTTAIVKRIEKQRWRIAFDRSKSVRVYLSPEVSELSTETEGSIAVGALKEVSPLRVAFTGKSRRWGTFLHELSKGTESRIVLELGALAGISGSYLASSPYCEKFVTIEGSTALSQIAQNTLSQFSSTATVINQLFDEALSKVLPTIGSVDLVFIDGHHEKRATLHYLDRIETYLSCGAYVIFDDISWSDDMRDAWTTIVRKPIFSHTFDLGEIGVCVYDPDQPKQHWDLRRLV